MTALGVKEIPGKCANLYRQIPGALLETDCVINKLKVKVTLLQPYGLNPLRSNPYLVWIKDEEGKIYSTTYFLENIAGLKIWKNPEIKSRLFTIYTEEGSGRTTIISRNVDKKMFDNFPLAVFAEEGSLNQPITVIKEGVFRDFIYSLSYGNLLEGVTLYIENKEIIEDAYPALKNICTNIQSVLEDTSKLEWLVKNLSKKREFEDIKASNFEDLSYYFCTLGKNKRELEKIKYGKGILALICKAFSYVPR